MKDADGVYLAWWIIGRPLATSACTLNFGSHGFEEGSPMAWRPNPGAITPALGDQSDDHWPAADRPIMSADQDMLERGRFAKRVAEVINGSCQREESSVLAIVGPWGSGKSSVINLARAELEALNPSWKICAANPWAPPDVPSLIAELFAAIRSGVPKGKRGRKATQLIAEWGALVSADLLLITGREKVLAMAAGVAARVARRGVQRPMQDVLQELSAELQSLNLQVLVILDDVDRLQPDELLMLFKQQDAAPGRVRSHAPTIADMAGPSSMREFGFC
jgi:predicted KAP-like P-loop ATPase